jgi:hypothetical protein
MPQLPHRPTTEQLVKAYSEGFEGWIWNLQVEREWEDWWSGRPHLYSQNAFLKDLHKKYKRVMLWQYRDKYDPGAYSQEAQTTGDCVSHGSRNARDTTRATEVARGEPEVYYKRGATEPTYGARNHGGQGMDPTAATRFEMEFGFLFREQYRETTLNVSLDLSKYNSNIGAGWGRSGVPSGVKELCKRHNVGDNTRPKTGLEVLDCLAAGSAGHSGQSWGTGNKTGADGLNRSNGSGWNHDMATVGYDISLELWKEPVVFVPNSWGAFNAPNPVWKANEDVLGPWIPGMIVIPLDEYERYFVRGGSIHFYSQIKGFPVKELPWIDDGVL